VELGKVGSFDFVIRDEGYPLPLKGSYISVKKKLVFKSDLL
jgi:hypothetical protein